MYSDTIRYTVVLARADWIEMQPGEAVVVVRVRDIGPDEAKRAARRIAAETLGETPDGLNWRNWPCLAVFRGWPRNETPDWFGTELTPHKRR